MEWHPVVYKTVEYFLTKWESPYYRQAELVSVDVLYYIREYDRHKHYQIDSNVFRLRKEILKDGFFKDMMIIEYWVKEGLTLLGEGNHRLSVMLLEGIELAPVRVIRNSYEYKKRYSEIAKDAKKGFYIEPDASGYVRGSLKPSEIGMPSISIPDFAREYM